MILMVRHNYKGKINQKQYKFYGQSGYICQYLYSDCVFLKVILMNKKFK